LTLPMKTLKFKTNINCGGCVATVTPYLNAVPDVIRWNVETERQDKLLTVTSAEPNGAAVEEAVRSAGFRIEPVF
jgi:copper chaperone CopZ